MSDSDNYFSDSDKSNNENPSDTNMSEDELSDSSMDEETRLIIYNTFQNRDPEKETEYLMDISPTSSKKNKEKKKKIKVKKEINLLELNQKLEGTTKKWISSRFKNKKDDIGITNEFFKRRCFNPRLPQPTKGTFKKKKETNILSSDTNMFPELIKSCLDSQKSKNINV